MATLVGRTLCGFHVEREIGRGGMGVVLLARQESLGRAAVLKRILQDLAQDPELAKRFEREARSAAGVHHHNVVAVYDLFLHRGSHYIAQEYVDGADLASVLLLEAPLPWRIAGLIALEVARGLEAVHAQATLHRDLKPANLMLGRGGEVKITDFGLALDASASSLTRPGVMLGTPSYMAPEQLRCERVDARCDVFALGCVLYEMLTGAPPFPCKTASNEVPAATLAERIQGGRYTRTRKAARGVPRVLARLVEQCLRAKPKRRLASARELRRRLESQLGNPSPADCKAELASWLWERGIFEVREEETVVRVVDAQEVPRPGIARRWTAAAALAMACAGLGFALAEPQVVMRATDSLHVLAAKVEAGVTSIPAALPARSTPEPDPPDSPFTD